MAPGVEDNTAGADDGCTPARVYACATCGKRYQRNTHLRRHEATHAATGKFRCIYCDKEFGRGDVCRKHMLSCIKKDTEAVVPELRRGRKPKACEACFTSKVSCDKGNPCSRCLAKHLTCRPRDVPEDVIKTSPSALSESSQSQASSSAPQTTSGNPTSAVASTGTEAGGMPWIKTLLNPRGSSMLENILSEAEEMTNRIPDMSFLSPAEANSAAATAAPMPELPDFMEFYSWNYGTMLDEAMFSFDGAEDINMLSLNDMPLVPGLSPSSAEGMEDTSMYLINALHDLHGELCANDPTYSEKFDVAAVTAALSPSNLKRFAATFFRLSHIHFPIVHIPSFGRTTSSKALLLILVIQGAFRSPPLDDVLTTRGLLRLAEEYIFRELQDSIALGSTQLPTQPTLEAMQAAVVLVYLLVINNSVSSRRQSRARRLPELAYAVRHYDLANVRHLPEEDWHLYIYRETCIRIATWTGIADWHQCGMFRCMPIMSTTELNCDHPCSTALWDAADAAEFAIAMAEDKIQKQERDAKALASPPSPSNRVKPQSSLREFLAALMGETWNRAEQCPPSSFNVYDLNAVIIALSAVALTVDLMSLTASSTPALMRAIARWQELWVDTTKELGTEALLKTGMVRHSNEMCCLTRKVVEASVNQSRHVYFRKVGHQSLTEIFSFLMEG